MQYSQISKGFREREKKYCGTKFVDSEPFCFCQPKPFFFPTAYCLTCTAMIKARGQFSSCSVLFDVALWIRITLHRFYRAIFGSLSPFLGINSPLYSFSWCINNLSAIFWRPLFAPRNKIAFLTAKNFFCHYERVQLSLHTTVEWRRQGLICLVTRYSTTLRLIYFQGGLSLANVSFYPKVTLHWSPLAIHVEVTEVKCWRLTDTYNIL